MSKYTATASLSVTMMSKLAENQSAAARRRKRGIQDSSLLYKGTVASLDARCPDSFGRGAFRPRRQLLRQPGSHQPVGRWYGYLRSQEKKKKIWSLPITPVCLE